MSAVIVAPSPTPPLARRAAASDPPSDAARSAVAITFGLAAALLVTLLARVHGDAYGTDFDQVWHAARIAGAGGDPYALIGPGRPVSQIFPLFYPLTAAAAVLPLAAIPLVAARAVFVGVSSGVLAWAATRDGWHRLPLFASPAWLMAVTAGQWSPLLTAALLVPALASLCAAKPNLGVAVLAATLGRRTWPYAFCGAVILAGVSLILLPTWPAAWLDALANGPHLAAPVTRFGGPLVLLALLRWRRPEARLLVALACVPQTTLMYEALPLFVIPRTWKESAFLAILCHAAFAIQGSLASPAILADAGAFARYVGSVGDVIVALVYLPCLLLVLRHGDVGTRWPRWLGRLAPATEAP